MFEKHTRQAESSKKKGIFSPQGHGHTSLSYPNSRVLSPLTRVKGLSALFVAREFQVDIAVRLFVIRKPRLDVCDIGQRPQPGRDGSTEWERQTDSRVLGCRDRERQTGREPHRKEEVSSLKLEESRIDSLIKVGRDRLTALSLLASRLLGFILLGLLYRLRRCPLALLVRAGARTSGGGRSALGGLDLALALAGCLGLGSLASGLLHRNGSQLQLLSDGSVVVGSVTLDATNVGHGDVELLAVADGLLIGHLLGGQVASLVRVDTSVVQAQVVLVRLVPALA